MGRYNQERAAAMAAIILTCILLTGCADSGGGGGNGSDPTATIEDADSLEIVETSGAGSTSTGDTSLRLAVTSIGGESGTATHTVLLGPGSFMQAE